MTRENRREERERKKGDEEGKKSGSDTQGGRGRGGKEGLRTRGQRTRTHAGKYGRRDAGREGWKEMTKNDVLQSGRKE